LQISPCWRRIKGVRDCTRPGPALAMHWRLLCSTPTPLGLCRTLLGMPPGIAATCYGEPTSTEAGCLPVLLWGEQARRRPREDGCNQSGPGTFTARQCSHVFDLHNVHMFGWGARSRGRQLMHTDQPPAPVSHPTLRSSVVKQRPQTLTPPLSILTVASAPSRPPPSLPCGLPLPHAHLTCHSPTSPPPPNVANGCDLCAPHGQMHFFPAVTKTAMV
jgi:hypothetical protein